MSPLHFVIMLIIAIIILTVLTLKFKMHPVMVLFLTATFCGLASGKTLVDTFAAITKYFGSTLGSIGVRIPDRLHHEHPRLRRHRHHPERPHLRHTCQAQEAGYAAGRSLR